MLKSGLLCPEKQTLLEITQDRQEVLTICLGKFIYCKRDIIGFDLYGK